MCYIIGLKMKAVWSINVVYCRPCIIFLLSTRQIVPTICICRVVRTPSLLSFTLLLLASSGFRSFHYAVKIETFRDFKPALYAIPHLSTKLCF